MKGTLWAVPFGCGVRNRVIRSPLGKPQTMGYWMMGCRYRATEPTGYGAPGYGTAEPMGYGAMGYGAPGYGAPGYRKMRPTGYGVMEPLEMRKRKTTLLSWPKQPSAARLGQAPVGRKPEAHDRSDVIWNFSYPPRAFASSLSQFLCSSTSLSLWSGGKAGSLCAFRPTYGLRSYVLAFAWCSAPLPARQILAVLHVLCVP